MIDKEIDFGEDILFIYKEGFALFNKKEKRFIIDASLWTQERHIRVGDKTFEINFEIKQTTREIENE